MHDFTELLSKEERVYARSRDVEFEEEFNRAALISSGITDEIRHLIEEKANAAKIGDTEEVERLDRQIQKRRNESKLDTRLTKAGFLQKRTDQDFLLPPQSASADETSTTPQS